MQTVQRYAYTIAAADGSLPIGDLLVVGLFASAIVLDSLSYIVGSLSSSHSRTRVQEKTNDDSKQKTYIYRSATGTAKSLTPRDKDTNGLSFSTVQPSGKYFRTTMETVNSSGVLAATVDPKNPTHILINPVDLSTLQGWIDSRETANENPHPYTLLLMSMAE